MMVHVSLDDVEANLARVELLGGDTSRVSLIDRIALMPVSFRRCPTVNYRQSVSSPMLTQRG